MPIQSATRLPIEWRTSAAPVPYLEAVAFMQARASAIADGTASEAVWLLEHPPLYTAGTSARREDLIEPDRFPVHATGRGGQYTYHGPGQRIAYVMVNLKARGGDVRAFVEQLERWLIEALYDCGIEGNIRPGRVGVWVTRQNALGATRDDKIAALGIRVSRGVTFHGVALNVAPELSHFTGIVPCGITGHGVTSLKDLGKTLTLSEVDEVLRRRFEPLFGPTQLTPNTQL